MSATRQIQRNDWMTYFDAFVKRHLEHDPPKAATVEVLSMATGDQVEVSMSRLMGFNYDRKSNAFQVLLEDVDHLVFHPAEIWVIEDEDGFISVLEVVRADGTKEIIRVQRSGVPATLYPAAP